VEKARVVDHTFGSGNPGIGEFLDCEGGHRTGTNGDFGFSSFTARAITAQTYGGSGQSSSPTTRDASRQFRQEEGAPAKSNR
jgi:hypothetical protein